MPGVGWNKRKTLWKAVKQSATRKKGNKKNARTVAPVQLFLVLNVLLENNKHQTWFPWKLGFNQASYREFLMNHRTTMSCYNSITWVHKTWINVRPYPCWYCSNNIQQLREIYPSMEARRITSPRLEQTPEVSVIWWENPTIRESSSHAQHMMTWIWASSGGRASSSQKRATSNTKTIESNKVGIVGDEQIRKNSITDWLLGCLSRLQHLPLSCWSFSQLANCHHHLQSILGCCYHSLSQKGQHWPLSNGSPPAKGQLGGFPMEACLPGGLITN